MSDFISDTSETEQAYNEGCDAYYDGCSEDDNPYDGILAEYWSDGWEDAKEDDKQ